MIGSPPPGASTNCEHARGIIARMNALNDLTTEVRFRERMRGYDFEEVDSYVKTVSRAVAQGRDQISELQQRLTQTESHVGNGDGLNETREMLLRTLVLAQRTADTAVSEARTEAKSITGSAQERAAKTVAEAESAANERLRSSEERAAQTVAEAEENCRLILAEAKRTAAAELTAERSRKIEEIEALEATRADLEAATAAIQARLDNERSQLRSLATSFQSFVEQFEPATDPGESTDAAIGADRWAQDMEVGEATIPDIEPANEETAERPAEADVADRPAIEFSLDPDGEVPAAEQDDGEAPAAEQAREAVEVEDAPADTLATDTLSADTLPSLPPVGWADEDTLTADAALAGEHSTGPAVAEPAHQESADLYPSDGPEAVAAPAMHSTSAGTPELFDIEAEEDDEFIEQLRQVVSSDAPLPSADAAMAAFFDHDEGVGRGGRLGQRA
jgi:DivIVA domain-containing protein